MSADNWRVCPGCIAEHRKKIEKMDADLAKAYGKISAEKYILMMEIVQKQKGMALEETLREDYAIGISEDGAFYVDYRASCDKCGFEFNYMHDETSSSRL